MDGFTRHEVAWLAGLTRQEAEDLDAPSSSWGRLRLMGGGDELPVVVLRDAVHAAAARVAGGEARVVLELRARGLTLREIAVAVGVPAATVARHAREAIDAIVDELGASVDLPRVASAVPMCLRCGSRPRARVMAERSGGRVLRAERPSSLCLRCTTPALRGRLVVVVEGRRASRRPGETPAARIGVLLHGPSPTSAVPASSAG